MLLVTHVLMSFLLRCCPSGVCLAPCTGQPVAGEDSSMVIGRNGDQLQLFLPGGVASTQLDAHSGHEGSCCEAEYIVEGDVRIQVLLVTVQRNNAGRT